MDKLKEKKTDGKIAHIKGKRLKNSAPKHKSGGFLKSAKGKLCFAFDFGEYATKIVVAKVSKDRINIRHMLVIENDDRNTKIDSSNVKSWRTKINRAFAKNNISSSGQLGLCTISSRNYISRQLEIPYADEADRQGLVSYEMSQNLSLDMDEHLFQHKVLRTYETNGIKMCSVWAVAIPKTLCESIYELMDSLKLKPMIMDINVNGMERLFSSEKSFQSSVRNGVVVTVDYGIRGTEIGFFEKGVYSQGVDVEQGDGRLVSAAKNVLGVQAADIHNDNKLVVSSQVVYGILQNANRSENARLFRENLEEWLSAVNDAIKRYNVSHPANHISHIFLYGGSPQMSWLRAYLEKYLGVSTTIIQKLDCYQIPDKNAQTGNVLPQFLNALNLLLIQ